jgi:OsmC subfamily peroxiredoxin
VTSPRKEKSASSAIVNAFLSEYRAHVGNVTIDTLDIWQEQLPEFDAEAISAKYKGVSGESMTPVETATWEKIRELASRFQRADRIVLGVPMWNFSVPYKLKQLIDLSCQRNLLFTFDGEFYGPSLSIDKAFVAYVRGQSDEAGFKTVSQPGFKYLSGYVEFWLQLIGVRSVVSLAVEHTWDGRAVDMIEAGKRQAAALARQFWLPSRSIQKLHERSRSHEKRFGSTTWSGGLREGKGSVSTESRALETYPYTFFSRYGEEPGTNPEELLGAAHAACFTMSFVRLLGMANFVPERVDSKSEGVIDKDGDCFSITSVHLTVTAKIPGIDQVAFQSIAAKAKAGCPVSKLMKVAIGFEANLLSWVCAEGSRRVDRGAMRLLLERDEIRLGLRRARTQRINAIGTS